MIAQQLLHLYHLGIHLNCSHSSFEYAPKATAGIITSRLYCPICKTNCGSYESLIVSTFGTATYYGGIGCDSRGELEMLGLKGN